MGASNSREDELELSDSDDSSYLKLNNFNTTDAAGDGFTLTTDSNKTKATEIVPEIQLSLNQWNSLLTQYLDQYEIVSMVFLLYEDPKDALSNLTTWLSQNTNNPLTQWIFQQSQINTQWQYKVIESLCIIQNFGILKQLGFRKNVLQSQYSPDLEISTYVKKLRKISYLVCEKLDQNATSIFLNKIKEYNVNIPCCTDNYLEIFFLYWEANNFTFSKIITVLKSMNCEVLCAMLEKYFLKENIQTLNSTQDVEKFKISSTCTDTNYRDHIAPGSLEHNSRLNTEPNHFRTDNDHLYEIDPENPGTVLIINQEYFYTEPEEQYKGLLPPNISHQLDSRQGTSKDRDDLHTVFKKLGFKMIIKNDLDHTQILMNIIETAESITTESSFFVCILSHGDKGVIYGVNSCKVEVNAIQDVMCKTNTKYLSGKPKCLILQSCQGIECQKIDNVWPKKMDESEYAVDGINQPVPVMADILTFWATVPGFAAIRNKKSGSWFIQTLCKTINEIGRTHDFVDICTRIMNEMAEKKWDENVMTPMIVSTLRKKFYLALSPKYDNFLRPETTAMN